MAGEDQKIILKGNKAFLKPVITELLAINQILREKDLGVLYGSPSLTFHERFAFKPQVMLYFLQPKGTVILPARRVEGEISFRIMNEESNTISRSKAKNIAKKIKELFAGGNGFEWKKGKKHLVYIDKMLGYQLKVLCSTETEGKKLITQVLAIQNHTPDWTRLNLGKNDQETLRFPDNPGTELILGKVTPRPKYRPTVGVKFQWAVMHLHGLSKPVPLCDRVGKLISPLADEE